MRLVFENRGAIAHDWVLANGTTHLMANAGQSTSTEQTFPTPGEYDVTCSYPSHGQYGMAGKLVVSADPAVTPHGDDAAQAPANPIPPGTTRLPPPAVAPPIQRTVPATVDVQLETREVVGLVDDQVATTFWTFGGTVPGPMVRVREGDTVNLQLTNAITSKESVQRQPSAHHGLGHPGEGHQIGQRQAHRRLLAGLLALILRRAFGGPLGRLGDLHPVVDEVRALGPAVAMQQGVDTAAHAVAEHDQLGDLEDPHGELQRGRGAVVGRVLFEGRHQVGDVADHEQLARPRAQDHLRIDAAVGAGDDHGLGGLALVGLGFETLPLFQPLAGAKAAIAFEQLVHEPSNA